jgi:hypothetical protein
MAAGLVISLDVCAPAAAIAIDARSGTQAAHGVRIRSAYLTIRDAASTGSSRYNPRSSIMPLSAGALGPCEIIGPLGVGGRVEHRRASRSFTSLMSTSQLDHRTRACDFLEWALTDRTAALA